MVLKSCYSAKNDHDHLIKKIFIQFPVRLTRIFRLVTNLQPLLGRGDPLNEALLETLENEGVLKRSKSPNGYVLDGQIDLPKDLTFEESLEMAQNALKEIELSGASGFSFSANIRFGDQQLLHIGESR